jgi:hypothetical protein
MRRLPRSLRGVYPEELIGLAMTKKDCDAASLVAVTLNGFDGERNCYCDNFSLARSLLTLEPTEYPENDFIVDSFFLNSESPRAL